MARSGLLLMFAVLFSADCIAQSVQIGAGYECLVPIGNGSRTSQGFGAGSRFPIRKDRNALEVRSGVLFVRNDRNGSGDQREETRFGGSVGFTWIATVGNAFRFDYGLEVGTFRRTFSTHYWTSSDLSQLQVLTVGPRLGLRCSASHWIQPCLMIQPLVEVPINSTERYNSRTTDSAAQLGGIALLGVWVILRDPPH